MADPSLLVSVPSVDDGEPGASRLLLDLRARTGAQPRRAHRLASRAGAHRRRCAGAGGRARLPDRRRRRAGVRPDRLAGDGHGAGHAVRAGAHLRPDRSVPAEQRRACGAGPGVRRLVHRARRRGADGARVGQARRSSASSSTWPAAGGPGRDGRVERPRDPGGAATSCAGSSTSATARPTTGRPSCCPASPAPTCTRSTASAATPTTSSTTSAPVDVEARAQALRAPDGAVLRRPGDRAVGAPGAEGGRAHGPRLTTSIPTASGASCARWRWTSPSTSYETWDDLLVYMDGSAAVIGEMMLPILDPPDLVAAQPHARDLGLAFQLTNFLRDIDEDLDRGRQYLPQDDLRRFGVDLRQRTGIGRAGGAHALRDRPLRTCCTVPPTWGSPCCPSGRPAACGPPACSTAGSSSASSVATSTCSPGGRACPRGRRRRWWRGRSVADRGRRCRDGRATRPRRSPRWRWWPRRSPAGGDDGRRALVAGGGRRRWRRRARCRRPAAGTRAGQRSPRRPCCRRPRSSRPPARGRGCRSGGTPTPARSDRRSAGCRSSCRWRGWRWRCRAVRPPTPHWERRRHRGDACCSAPRR